MMYVVKQTTTELDMEQIVSEFGEATVYLSFRETWSLKTGLRGVLKADPGHDHEAVEHATSVLHTSQGHGVLKIDSVFYTPTSIIGEMLSTRITETPSTHILGRKRYTAIDDALAQRIIDYNTPTDADVRLFPKQLGYRSVRSRARAEVIVAFVFAVTN
jgi:hypothetical protein